MSKCNEKYLIIYVRKLFFRTPGNPSLAHQEVVSYVMSETPTKKIRSLTVSIINAADNVKFSEKLTTTQEEGYVAYYTAHVE